MKIGILTFHNAHNYGAVLQAYALKSYLSELGNDVNIINYINPQIASNYVKEGKFDDEKKQLQWERQHDRFEQFIHSKLLENNANIIDGKSIEELKYDAFICGSDQIWNSGLTGGLDKVYFLDFNTKAIRISYAPSKYKDWIKDEEKEYFAKTLSRFEFLSTREESLSYSLKKLVDKEIATVIDPVFLIEKEQYVDMVEETYTYEDYILVYYLTEDERLNRYARQIQDVLNIPIVEIHFFEATENGNIQLSDCGPLDFVSLFSNSKYVITNSFHGTAFSVIFRKNFISIYEKDNRKDQLLKNINLENRKYFNEDIKLSELEIDYSIVEERLNNWIDYSKDYLRKAVKHD